MGGEVTMTATASSGKQDFLEAEPYWDQSTVPVNTYKNKSPFTAKVISTKRIVGPKATGETCHIIMNHDGKMPYWEGQSYGVIPPGINPKNGRPNTVRLYSIASSRYGDDMTGTTTSLCVRRAPYRSFIRRLFVEDSPFAADYKGLAWLFLGVANTDALLYDDEWQPILKKFPDNFRLDYALSREQTNAKGGKMYIQDKVEEYSDEVFDKLENGAHIYFCGLKGMMPGITDMLQGVAEKKGLDYEEWQKELKAKKQWHVEVY